MPDNAALVRAALSLREVEPALWAGFVGVMEEYASGSVTDMMRAAPEMLQRAQGMAIMANEIAAVLRDAPAIHDKAMEAQRKQHNARKPTGPGGY